MRGDGSSPSSYIDMTKYQGHRLDHWHIALSIEMMRWDDVMKSIDDAIEWIYSISSGQAPPELYS